VSSCFIVLLLGPQIDRHQHATPRSCCWGGNTTRDLDDVAKVLTVGKHHLTDRVTRRLPKHHLSISVVLWGRLRLVVNWSRRSPVRSQVPSGELAPESK
jgi:hypothetical protein